MTAAPQLRSEDDGPVVPTDPGAPTPSARSYLILGIAAVAAHVAITLGRLHSSYFFVDDFLQLELAREARLGPRYLVQEMFGHVEPLTMLAHWLFAHFAGWNYGAARIVLVTLSAGAVAILAAIAKRVRAPLPIAVVIVLASAVSWITIEPDRWWSNGILVTSCSLLSMAALWICARPRAALNGIERWGLALVLVADCAFYNKAVLMVFLCGGVRMFVATSPAVRAEPASLPRIVRSACADLGLALVGVTGFLALVFAVKAGSFAPPAPTSKLQVLEGLAVGLQYGWLGGVAGLRLGDHASKIDFLGSAVVLDALAGFVVLSSVRRNASAAWLWAGLIVSLACGLGAISLQRTAQFGVMMMTIGRYHTDGVFMTFAATLIAFGLALGPKTPRGPGRARATAVAATIGVVVLALQIANGLHYPAVWDTQGNRRFIERLERDAHALSASDLVADRMLPDRIAPRWMQPWNDLSKLAPILPRPFRTAGLETATYVMGDDGALHALAGAPRLKLRQPDGSDLILTEAPSFADEGFLDKASRDQATGWFNCLLANPDKVRIAIVADGRILAWATRVARPDVAVAYGRGVMAGSGFAASLPQDALPGGDLHAVAVIDGRIGVVLPRA